MATIYDSLDSDIEEEEEERMLSEQHGEAAEEGTDRKRKDAPDMDYSGDVKPKKRIARPKVTTEILTGMNGLIRIPDDFQSTLRSIPRDHKSAAKYTSTLMKLYTTFCFDLLPSQATADVQLQIENLGSKKEVKAYLQNMRDAARNRHVEHLLGREKAEKLLNELELGLRQQEEYAPEDSYLGEQRDQQQETDLETNPRPQESSPRPVTRTPNEARMPAAARINRLGRKTIHDDSSDEEEAVFDEPSIVSPVKKDKRSLPEQDAPKQDDDDDNAAADDLEMPLPGVIGLTEDASDSSQKDSTDTGRDESNVPESDSDPIEEDTNKDDPEGNASENSTVVAPEKESSNLDGSNETHAESVNTDSSHENAKDNVQVDVPQNDPSIEDSSQLPAHGTRDEVQQEDDGIEVPNAQAAVDAHDLDTEKGNNEEVSFQVATQEEHEEETSQVATQEPLSTETNGHVVDSISFAQPTQDVQDSQQLETSTAMDSQPTQMSEAPTIVADTQSMDFETQLSQMNDEL